MEIQEENNVLMMQSLGFNNTEDQMSLSDEKNQLHDNIEDETQLAKSFHDLLLKCNLRLIDKDRLLEKYRNENKLLKGRLKGCETLASLYAKSKLVNSQLQKQCEEQRILLEQLQTNGLSPLTIHSTENSRDEGELFSEDPERHFDSFELIDSPLSDQNKFSSPVKIARPLQNDQKENSIRRIEKFGKAGRADEEAEKQPKSTVDQGCGTDRDGSHCLKQNEADSGPFEIRELNAFERFLKDVNSSNESKDLLMELLMVGMKIISLESHLYEDEDKEYHSSGAKVSAHQLCEQLTSCLKPGSSAEVSTLDEATQTGDVERKVAPKANSFTRQLLPDDVGCFLNEMQILQSQALTFKDDFERERKDLEKIRSKYETMKKHYNKLTAEYSMHKVQLRDLQLGQARKREAAMKQRVNMAAAKLNAFQPSIGLCHLKPNPSSPPKWMCMRCTFMNCNAGKTCEMCGLDRSHLKKKGR